MFCISNQSSEASSDNKENTEQVEKKDEAAEVKEKVTKDAGDSLDSVLTSDSARFKKIYGDTYEKWTEAVFAVQTSEKIKEEGLHLHLPIQYNGTKISCRTPEETISGFLKMRRRLYQDIGSYTVKDVEVDESGNTATVTFNSKSCTLNGFIYKGSSHYSYWRC